MPVRESTTGATCVAPKLARTRYRSRQSRKTRYMAPQRMRIVMQATTTSLRPEWSEPRAEWRVGGERPSGLGHQAGTGEIGGRPGDHWACWPWLLGIREPRGVILLFSVSPAPGSRSGEGVAKVRPRLPCTCPDPDLPARQATRRTCWSPAGIWIHALNSSRLLRVHCPELEHCPRPGRSWAARSGFAARSGTGPVRQQAGGPGTVRRGDDRQHQGGRVPHVPVGCDGPGASLHCTSATPACSSNWGSCWRRGESVSPPRIKALKSSRNRV